ncbi:putative reverse transcriptase domain-containing protein [Tanacetum coccineum]
MMELLGAYVVIEKSTAEIRCGSGRRRPEKDLRSIECLKAAHAKKLITYVFVRDFPEENVRIIKQLKELQEDKVLFDQGSLNHREHPCSLSRKMCVLFLQDRSSFGISPVKSSRRRLYETQHLESMLGTLDKQDEAFQTLKEKLCNAPVLALPDGPDDFVVYCDASKQGFGKRFKIWPKAVDRSYSGDTSVRSNTTSEQGETLRLRFGKGREASKDLRAPNGNGYEDKKDTL